MSLELWDQHLDDPSTPLHVGFEGGHIRPLPTLRWCGRPTEVDEIMLRRATPPVLDVGCGPGRLAAALNARGVEALGIDVSAVAVAKARLTGARVHRGSVFDPLPGEGSWGSVLLADGNVGIGGDPRRLLGRVSRLLRPGGIAILEVEPEGDHDGSVEWLRLHLGSAIGSAFRWARLDPDAVERLVRALPLSVTETWTAVDADCETRRFVEVMRDSA